MRSSIPLLLLFFVFHSSSANSIPCYGGSLVLLPNVSPGSSIYNNRPRATKKYIPLLKQYNRTEFYCKELCFMKRMVDESKLDYTSSDFSLSVAGCGDEECKNWDRNSTGNSTKTDENGITTTLYCCEGEHCFSEERVKDFLFETSGVIAIDYGDLRDWESIPRRESDLITKNSPKLLGFVFFVWVLVNLE